MVLIHIIKKHKIKKENQLKTDFQNKVFYDNQFHIDEEYFYRSLQGDIDVRFCVDRQKQLIIIFQKHIANFYHIVIPFSEIIGCNVISDGRTQITVSGGIISSAQSKHNVLSYSIFIYRNNPDCPKNEIRLLNYATDSNSLNYKNLSNFASQVYSCLESIKLNVAVNNTYNRQLNANLLIADEIEKLVKLKNDDVISEEEFNIRKQKLIMR